MKKIVMMKVIIFNKKKIAKMKIIKKNGKDEGNI